MTKESLIAAFAEKYGLTKAESERRISDVLTTFIDLAKEAISKGDKATLPGILSISTKIAKPRTGRNPKTGEEIKIPERVRVKASFASKFQNFILGEDQ